MTPNGQRLIALVALGAIAGVRSFTVGSHTRRHSVQRPIGATRDFEEIVQPAQAPFIQRDWSPASWRTKDVEQLPDYPDPAVLEQVERDLTRCAPLVFAGEVRELHDHLSKACMGQGFLLMGGDCAESFDDFNVDRVRDSFRIILQMALTMTYGSGKPIIKVGRMAGQFAKPRSSGIETIDGVSLPSYRGDNVNGAAFTEESRTPDPNRMMRAYHQSRRRSTSSARSPSAATPTSRGCTRGTSTLSSRPSRAPTTARSRPRSTSRSAS